MASPDPVAEALAADLLERLHPLRPPAATLSATLADAAAAAALGLMLAAALAMLFWAVVGRRRRPGLDASRGLPPRARLAAILAAARASVDASDDGDWLDRLARRSRSADVAQLRGARAALYDPAATADPEAVEAAARGALKRLRRLG